MAGFSGIGFFAAGFILLTFLTSKAYSITCYVCNSEYDTSCEDPFKPYSSGVLNCSLAIRPDHIAGRNPKVCRKIVQKIEGMTRIIRSCGYIEDPLRDNKECLKRSGTHDVHVDYCSCTGDLCNGTATPTYNFYCIVISAVFGMNVFNKRKIFPSYRVL